MKIKRVMFYFYHNRIFTFTRMSNINDQELIVELQNQINELLENEELKDLETVPTEREIDTLIAVEQGQAFQISLDRSPLPSVRKSPSPY